MHLTLAYLSYFHAVIILPFIHSYIPYDDVIDPTLSDLTYLTLPYTYDLYLTFLTQLSISPVGV